MRTRESPVNLFQYRDYRVFLKDWYQAAKRSRASFSFRTFSKRAGFKSTNFFKLVMDGERNLTDKSLAQFMEGLRLNKQEQTFFWHLVHFNQAQSNEEKNFHYKSLLQSQKFYQLKLLEKDQYDYFSNWYHSVIRELIVSSDYDGTLEWVQRRLIPRLSVTQIKKSIALLQKLELIQCVDGKRWVQYDTLISTGSETKSVAIMKCHQEILDITKNTMEQIPASDRDISTLVLGIKKENFQDIKGNIRTFRQQILKSISTVSNPEEVVLLNIQLLPVTQSLSIKEDKVV